MEAHLSCLLTGEAAQCLWDLTGLRYHELMSKLEDRFGTRGHEESYRHKLHILRRKHAKSLGELAQVTKRLMCGKPGHFSRECPQGKGVNKDVGRLNQSTCSSGQAIYLPICVDGKRKLGLLDSGSSVSILPTSMIELLIEVGKHSRPALFLVSDSVSEILLGLDWLKLNDVLWKFGQTKITIGKDSAAVGLVTKDVGVNRMCRIESNREVEIPARTEFDVP
ncbi:hypothetical protein HELRODRAFT_164995 [Helobdella robusta]|uniref:CCHC-type domain-containing protein n=1 Tax=Helobdella robusta TaxID=6412 RepID=T1EW33_HELRO|nr:hypothetical protein HELRODRAFT_164995 [Helobdella robusta]ESN92863.1 hypothetical protein HELRODRAFT_164995 [Helobdella robusta]